MSAQENAVRMEELTSLERLGLRVSAMINSPLAQLDRRVLVHRMDTDTDHDWESIMELLAETDGLDMTFCDDGSVFLKWDAPTDDDRVIDRGEEVARVETEEEEAPF
ncbi:DUF1654 domain-containing protein [Pseudomonas sp. S31]|uniref:DUF1654 domain-containing protein n=1 Tax=Pseudomonas sp. S31 TaxID=1564473 RepID=UPI001F3CAFF9|nr:DUF1654 domain-containing protein [Pseudomonas sp. S31]MBK5003033.1 DUF1654 domain-containing protein [Pseudomonas sp. S31]